MREEERGGDGREGGTQAASVFFLSLLALASPPLPGYCSLILSLPLSLPLSSPPSPTTVSCLPDITSSQTSPHAPRASLPCLSMDVSLFMCLHTR